MSDVVMTPVWKCCGLACVPFRCMLRVYRPHDEWSTWNVGYWFDVDYCYVHNRLYHWSLNDLAANMQSAFYCSYTGRESALRYNRAHHPSWNRDYIVDRSVEVNEVFESGLEILDVARTIVDYADNDSLTSQPCLCNLHLYYLSLAGNPYLTAAERGLVCVMFLGMQLPPCWCLPAKLASIRNSHLATRLTPDLNLARFRYIHESGTAVCGGEHDIEVISSPS